MESEKRRIIVPNNFSVGELAAALELPVTQVIGELFKNGIIATINQKVDIDTAQIIVEELGLQVNLEPEKKQETIKPKEQSTDFIDARPRPPIVAIMGHVDHGKTTLLDTIIGLKVVDGEAGGITQHIAAYQKIHNGRYLTFLDTPGHEAFSSLRQHGANLTDIAVVVVAADDGIKPQTLEAIRFANLAGVKIIIAVTKIDKPAADQNRIKQQLADNNMLPEEWGGNTIVVGLSAKTGEGIDNLLDLILLVTDIDELKAEYAGPAIGMVIESHVETGKGPVADVLITSGILKKGDFVAVGSAFGKIKTLDSWDLKTLSEAAPATPVTISGIKTLPDFGQLLVSYASENEAKNAAKSYQANTIKAHNINSEEILRIMARRNETSEMPIIIKADVQGSLQSVTDAINLIQNEEVKARIVGSGVGTITESDLMQAESSRAIIYGFHVEPSNAIKKLADSRRVIIKTYKVIYELLDDIKSRLSNLLEPETLDTPTGRLLVKGVFRTDQSEIICGGEVTKGFIIVPCRAKVFRDDIELGEVQVTKLQEKQQEVKEVQTGTMCGLTLITESKIKIELGDRLEIYKRDIIRKTL